jgi:hypothetical protein
MASSRKVSGDRGIAPTSSEAHSPGESAAAYSQPDVAEVDQEHEGSPREIKAEPIEGGKEHLEALKRSFLRVLEREDLLYGQSMPEQQGPCSSEREQEASVSPEGSCDASGAPSPERPPPLQRRLDVAVARNEDGDAVTEEGES